MRDRTNEDWLNELSNGEPERGAAAADLREILRRGLNKAVGHRPGVDVHRIEDFAQEAVLTVIARLSSFRGESRFITWALAVAIWVAISELRRACYKDVSLEWLSGGPHEPRKTFSLSDPLTDERENVLALLNRLIGTDLTDKQRAVIRGEIEGIPQAVIIERLGSNRNAVYKLSHDARMRLKKGLVAAGITAEWVLAALDKSRSSVSTVDPH